MSLIKINNLTFAYDGSYDNVFENVSLAIDTQWRLGLTGRNGRGKTTLLHLLMGQLEYEGTIESSVRFEYFPYHVEDAGSSALSVARSVIADFDEMESRMELLAQSADPDSMEQYGEVFERYVACDGYNINTRIEVECARLGMEQSVLAQPFATLSSGEKTKLMLAALFLKPQSFLLIDEPTNHLDVQGRRLVSEYLRSKSGFILVSHDRSFLDGCIDHILSINRQNIELQHGNYSSWKINRERQETYERTQDEKLRRQITTLQEAADRAAGVSSSIEKQKHGVRLAGLRPDRGALGATSAKVMKRAKVLEARREHALEEKIQLLKNVEEAESLALTVLDYPKRRLIEVSDLSLRYGERVLFEHLSFSLEQGERVALVGCNGCGKSSLVKFLLGADIAHAGHAAIGSNMCISYIPQDFDCLRGNMREYIAAQQIDEHLFKAILRKLDFTRSHFDRAMETFSSGQKKKVLLACAIAKPAHLFIWDEPLNYIDILSREQIEQFVMKYMPTMLFIEHDEMFTERTATRFLKVEEYC